MGDVFNTPPPNAPHKFLGGKDPTDHLIRLVLEGQQGGEWGTRKVEAKGSSEMRWPRTGSLPGQELTSQ